MKNTIKFLAATLMIMSLTSAKAEIQVGVGLLTGQSNVTGTETENGERNSREEQETFFGADIFIENVFTGGYLPGLTIGASVVPFDIELGSGRRNETGTANTDDVGTRTASASLSNLITVYANVPVYAGWYALVGGHMTTVETDENNLPNSSYGDEDIFGVQVGFGKRMGKLKLEASYSDFDDIAISGKGGDNNTSITADADAYALRVSYGF